jgi:hypothetical protein
VPGNPSVEVHSRKLTDCRAHFLASRPLECWHSCDQAIGRKPLLGSEQMAQMTDNGMVRRL